MKMLFTIFVLVSIHLVSTAKAETKLEKILGFGTLRQVIYSPDGKKLASCGGGGIFIWYVATGDTILSIRENTGYVNCIAFSPDGSKIASGSYDNTIKLWDVNTGAEIGTLTGHTDLIASVCFSPDGTKIVSGSDSTIILWVVKTGKEIRTLTGHTSFVNSVSFSPDGSKIASGSLDNTIKLWDANTGAEIRTLTGDNVCFSPDGTIISGGNGDEIILWDVITGTEIRTLTGHMSGVKSACFSSDGTKIASGYMDKTIKLWDVNTGTEIKTLTGHASEVTSVCFSPDGSKIASGSWDNTIKIWVVNTGAEIRTLTGHTAEVLSISFSPDGSKIVNGGNFNNTIKIWNVNTGAEIRTLTGHTSYVNSVCFSPDGSKIVSGSYDKTIKLWDVNTGTEIRTLTGHTSEVTSVCFSPDGSKIASGSQDNTIKLWDVNTGAEIRTLKGHSNSVWCVCFNPDGTKIASGSYETIKLWDVSTGAEIRTLTGHTSYANVCFSPDGTKIVSGSYDKTIKLWDVNTGTEIRTLTGHTYNVLCVSFSPEGSKLASGSVDNTIKIWNVNTGAEIRTLTGHTSYVNSISFRPDGSKIASGGGEGTIRIWNVDENTLDTIIVLSPNGKETLEVNKNYEIKWSFSGNSTDRISIDYTTNNGSNWSNIATNLSANSFTYNWLVPNTPSSNCLVRITDLNNTTLSDVSDNVFTIKSSTPQIKTNFPDTVKICSHLGAGGMLVKNNLATNINKKYRLTFSGTFSIWNRVDNCSSETNSCCGLDAGYLYSIPQKEIDENRMPSNSVLPLPAWVGDNTLYQTSNDIILRDQTGFRFNGEPLSFSKYQPSHIYNLENKQGIGDYFSFQIIDSIKNGSITSPSYTNNCGCIDVIIEELPDNQPVTKICDQTCILDKNTNEVKGIMLKTALMEYDPNSTTGKRNKLSKINPESLGIVINGKFLCSVDSIRCENSEVSKEDIPISFGLLVDISQSMIDTISSSRKIDAAKEALKNFVTGMRKGDKACLMTFAEDTKTALDWTADKTLLTNSISNLNSDQFAKTTYLYSAIELGINKLNSITGSKALIILGDGDDNSGMKWDSLKLLDKVKNTNNQPIYIVLVNDGKMELKDKDKLIELANQSGGKTFDIKSSSELNELYSKLGQDLVNEECCTIYISKMTDKKGYIRMIYSPNDTIFTSRLTYFDCNFDIPGIVFQGKDEREILMNVIPNPLNSSAEIRYETPERGIVEITIYDMLGNKLNMISKGFQEIGKYTEIIDGSNLESGSYIATVTLNGRTVSRKIIVIH